MSLAAGERLIMAMLGELIEAAKPGAAPKALLISALAAAGEDWALEYEFNRGKPFGPLELSVYQEAEEREGAVAARAGEERRADLLTGSERIIVAMVGELMAAFEPRSQSDGISISDYAYQGDDRAIERAYPTLFRERVCDRETIIETADILQMWAYIEPAVDMLEGEQASEAARWPWRSFQGFDPNQGDHAHVATVMIRQLRRFSPLVRHDLDSGSPIVLQQYRDMYREHQRMLMSGEWFASSFENLKHLCTYTATG